MTYFDDEHSVFPSEELLDELHLYDTASRKIVQKALQDFVDDFNLLLVDRGIYDYFYANCYRKVLVKNDSVLFI